MKRYIGLLRCILLFLQNTAICFFSAASYTESTPPETESEYVSGRVLVKLRSAKGMVFSSAAHTARRRLTALSH